MKIALCDDESCFTQKLRAYIEQKLETRIRCDINEFHSGEELLEEYKKNAAFDIVFLDIEMSGIDGIETARRVRRQDGKAIIVFLTSHQEYSIDGYEVRAFRYIIKKEPGQLLAKHMNDIFKEYLSMHKTILIRTRENKIALKIENILYVEVFNRVILVHVHDKYYEFYGKLADMEKELLPYSFTKINKSCLVNLVHAQEMSSSSILLKNGLKLPVSRKYRSNTDNAFIEHLMGR